MSAALANGTPRLKPPLTIWRYSIDWDGLRRRGHKMLVLTGTAIGIVAAFVFGRAAGYKKASRGHAQEMHFAEGVSRSAHQ